jgi:DNA-binding NarL/FixJ family response regulator
VAQPYRLEESASCVLAFEALEDALRGLKDEVARTARRCQEVRRAYEQLMEAAAADGKLPRVGPESALRRLTPRERVVAALAAEGRSNAQVAAELHVSLHTVKSQMRSVLHKLQIESRWQIDRGRWSV